MIFIAEASYVCSNACASRLCKCLYTITPTWYRVL